MKKAILLSGFMGLLTLTMSAQMKIAVNGTVAKGVEGNKVYLLDEKRTPVDSAEVKDGTFKFPAIVADSVCLNYLKLKHYAMKIYLEKEGTLNVKIIDDKKNRYRVNGSVSNDAYSVFADEWDPMVDEYRQLNIINDTTMDAKIKDDVRVKMDALEIKMENASKSHMEKNLSNRFGKSMLLSRRYSMELDEVQHCLDMMSAEDRKDIMVKTIERWLDKQKSVGVGMPYQDFSMASPEGKILHLSNFVGKKKVVLIDFWASWCGPCRGEMPNVVKAYKKYKSKGLEIVGVSLDRDAASWKKAIKDLGITWPQMSDLKYWNCEGAKLYGVSAIPATVLIDAEGKIIARNLRGEALDKKLEEILK